MTALTKSRLTRQREGSRRRLPVAASVAVWQGAMVALSGALAVPADATAAHRVLGVAQATADNRLGAAGALSVDYERGVFLMENDAADPLTAADIGAACYVTDDQTVCKTAGTKPQAGKVFDVDPSGRVWVDIG